MASEGIYWLVRLSNILYKFLGRFMLRCCSIGAAIWLDILFKEGHIWMLCHFSHLTCFGHVVDNLSVTEFCVCEVRWAHSTVFHIVCVCVSLSITMFMLTSSLCISAYMALPTTHLLTLCWHSRLLLDLYKFAFLVQRMMLPSEPSWLNKALSARHFGTSRILLYGGKTHGK